MTELTEETAGLGEIPFVALSERSLHLGPFDSGRSLATFLCAAILGAIVAAASSVVLWLPFLGLGALLAFVRVEGQPLDDYALGYCRYGLRTVFGDRRSRRSRREETGAVGSEHIVARGIPVAYLPLEELHRLFSGWRTALGALRGPIAIQVSSERFSPVPYLPALGASTDLDRSALRSYRELVRLLLSTRFRRRIDLRFDPSDGGVEIATQELLGALEKLGIPAERIPRAARRQPAGGVNPR